MSGILRSTSCWRLYATPRADVVKVDLGNGIKRSLSALVLRRLCLLSSAEELKQ